MVDTENISHFSWCKASHRRVSHSLPLLVPLYQLVAAPPARHQPFSLCHFANTGLGIWSWRGELNPQPALYKSAALPIELHQRSVIFLIFPHLRQERIRIVFIQESSPSSTITFWMSAQEWQQKNLLKRFFILLSPFGGRGRTRTSDIRLPKQFENRCSTVFQESIILRRSSNWATRPYLIGGERWARTIRA